MFGKKSSAKKTSSAKKSTTNETAICRSDPVSGSV